MFYNIYILLFLFVFIDVLYCYFSSEISWEDFKKRSLNYIWIVSSFLLVSFFLGEDVKLSELIFLFLSSAVSFFVSIRIYRSVSPKYLGIIEKEFSELLAEKDGEGLGVGYLVKKAFGMTIFFIPFLFITNVLIQVLAVSTKSGDPGSVFEHMGTFGDFFGGVLNPILTFATFMALVATIILQLKELKETRKEIENSVDAQKESADALVEQKKILDRQVFESRFFQQLGLLVEKSNNIDAELEKTIEHMKHFAGREPESVQAINKDKDIFESYFESNPSYHSFISNYVYFSLFIDGQFFLSDEEKNKYMDIVRSSINGRSIFLIFFNFSSVNGFEYSLTNKRNIERYSFFRDMNINQLVNRTSFKNREKIISILEDIKKLSERERDRILQEYKDVRDCRDGDHLQIFLNENKLKSASVKYEKAVDNIKAKNKEINICNNMENFLRVIMLCYETYSIGAYNGSRYIDDDKEIFGLIGSYS